MALYGFVWWFADQPCRAMGRQGRTGKVIRCGGECGAADCSMTFKYPVQLKNHRECGASPPSLLQVQIDHFPPCALLHNIVILLQDLNRNEMPAEAGVDREKVLNHGHICMLDTGALMQYIMHAFR